MKPIYVIIIIVLVAVGGFFGGMEYQKRSEPQLTLRNSNGQVVMGQRGQGGQFQGRAMQGFRPVTGEIISQDENGITVKSEDGSSKIVIVSDTTAINKAEQGSKTDLKVGERVAAFGKENSDGSITAQNVQLNPGDRMMIRQEAPQTNGNN